MYMSIVYEVCMWVCKCVCMDVYCLWSMDVCMHGTLMNPPPPHQETCSIPSFALQKCPSKNHAAAKDVLIQKNAYCVTSSYNFISVPLCLAAYIPIPSDAADSTSSISISDCCCCCCWPSPDKTKCRHTESQIRLTGMQWQSHTWLASTAITQGRHEYSSVSSHMHINDWMIPGTLWSRY